jgi:hypothetical protein
MSKDDFKCGYCSKTLDQLLIKRYGKRYCNSVCKLGAARERRARVRNEVNNLKLVRNEWKRRYPKSRIKPAWPHRFNADMICQHCGIHWEENQCEDQPRCTNPKAGHPIAFNVYGKPKLL